MISFHTLIALALFGLTISLPHAVNRFSLPAVEDPFITVEFPVVDRLDIFIPPPNRASLDTPSNVLGLPTPALPELDAREWHAPRRPTPMLPGMQRPARAARGERESM